jgi:ketosteroid isomerase-like protein
MTRSFTAPAEQSQLRPRVLRSPRLNDRAVNQEGGMAPTTTEQTGIEADVLRTDDRRFEAMRKGDWGALDAALADELTYVHSTARLETKGEHIANLRAGRPHYRGIAPRERRARVHGNVGVVNGVSEMHVERDGKEQRFTVRYLAVYAKTGDHWRMIAWQSTKVPDA